MGSKMEPNMVEITEISGIIKIAIKEYFEVFRIFRPRLKTHPDSPEDTLWRSEVGSSVVLRALKDVYANPWSFQIKHTTTRMTGPNRGDACYSKLILQLAPTHISRCHMSPLSGWLLEAVGWLADLHPKSIPRRPKRPLNRGWFKCDWWPHPSEHLGSLPPSSSIWNQRTEATFCVEVICKDQSGWNQTKAPFRPERKCWEN